MLHGVSCCGLTDINNCKISFHHSRVPIVHDTISAQEGREKLVHQQLYLVHLKRIEINRRGRHDIYSGNLQHIKWIRWERRRGREHLDLVEAPLVPPSNPNNHCIDKSTHEGSSPVLLLATPGHCHPAHGCTQMWRHLIQHTDNSLEVEHMSTCALPGQMYSIQSSGAGPSQRKPPGQHWFPDKPTM